MEYLSAAYPKTTPSEQRSADILVNHLDRRYIQGVPLTSDKVPNSDGFLTITDENRVHIGFVDIQLKTLSRKNVHAPRFSCSRKLLAYASSNLLPVILIVVDQLNERPYWLYLSPELLDQLCHKGTGKTVTVSIPIENVISRTNLDYISTWTNILARRLNKVQLYDQVYANLNTLQKSLGEMGRFFEPAQHLTGQDIREIHIFLDHYNNLLDKEFRAVKNVLFYNYWKIGIGIINYTANQVRYVLMPQSYQNNTPLIKALKKGLEIQLHELFWEGVLSLNANEDSNHLKDEPALTALTAIKDNVKDVIGKTNLAIGNEFMSREYLGSFLDTFSVYLGIDQAWKQFPVERLSQLLFAILPVAETQQGYFADHIREMTFNIDTYKNKQLIPYFSERIAAAEKLLAEGFVPKVSIVLTSQLFDFNLIAYYLDWLLANKVQQITRMYPAGQAAANWGKQTWQIWDKVLLQKSLTIFFTGLQANFEQLVQQQFPLLHQELNLFQSDDLIIFTLIYDDKKEHEPYLRYYRLTTNHKVNQQIWFYPDVDDCPIEMKDIYENSRRSWEFNGLPYQLHINGNKPLTFIYSKLPTYTFLMEQLSGQINGYLNKKIADQQRDS